MSNERIEAAAKAWVEFVSQRIGDTNSAFVATDDDRDAAAFALAAADSVAPPTAQALAQALREVCAAVETAPGSFSGVVDISTAQKAIRFTSSIRSARAALAAWDERENAK